jgi:hypothetical protein
MDTLDKCGIFASLLEATMMEVARGFGYNSEKRFNNPLFLKERSRPKQGDGSS